jgi:phosphoenolpyruvate carboxykinase (ATP)
MSLHPSVYGNLLMQKMQEHAADCWLINTGWTGGPYGVGRRMDINHTRAMLDAALSGALNGVAMTEDPIFRVMVPESCPGVPSEVLRPENTWEDKAAYRQQAEGLARLFQENFKEFEALVSDEVKGSGPQL